MCACVCAFIDSFSLFLLLCSGNAEEGEKEKEGTKKKGPTKEERMLAKMMGKKGGLL